jgi:hypothetical protein
MRNNSSRRHVGSSPSSLIRRKYTEQFKKKVTLSHVYNEVTSEPTITWYTTIVRKTLKVCLQLTRESVSGRRRQGRPCCKMATPQQNGFWIQNVFCCGAVAARNTFPRQLQTNFESFHNNCCISRDCRLTGYFIINMWKCYLLFELLCINVFLFTFVAGYKPAKML